VHYIALYIYFQYFFIFFLQYLTLNKNNDDRLILNEYSLFFKVMKILKHFYFSEASEPSEALYKISEGFRKE
jgi:hypothetical protein